jgi:hypothetical protein
MVQDNCVTMATSVLSIDELSSESLSIAARQFLMSRCGELDQKVISEAVELIIGPNSSWLVLWGVIIGAVLAAVSRLSSWFWDISLTAV